MFFGALSTDIKKSSTIWANLPLWMQKAVERTNNITEFIINNTKNKDIEQHILPNSPEGDAWTVVYMCNDQEKLKKHVKHVAQFLKHVYKEARERYILRASKTAIDKNIKRIIRREKKPNNLFITKILHFTEKFTSVLE